MRSERAGQRVMASLSEFIEGPPAPEGEPGQVGCRPTRGPPLPRLPAAVRPAHRGRGGAVVGAHQALTRWSASASSRRSNWGSTLADCITGINAWLRGWHGFFGIASVTEMQMMRKIDAHIRRRLRAIILRHWKRKRTIATASRHAGRQPAGGVAAGLPGPQVLVGAEPHQCGRPRPAQRVLRQARACVGGRPASSGAPADRRPRAAATGVMGMTSRSQTGRRRGS